MSLHRPYWLIVLCLAVAVMQAINAFRVLMLPDDLSISLIVPLEIGFGALWAGLFLSAVLGLWRRNSGTFLYAVVLLCMFAVYSVVRAAVFAQAAYHRGRLPFLLILLSGFFLLMAFALQRRYRQNTEIFKDGRESQD